MINGMASQLDAAGFDLGELEEVPTEDALEGGDPGEAVDPPAEVLPEETPAAEAPAAAEVSAEKAAAAEAPAEETPAAS